MDQAKQVLRFYRDWSAAAPDELRADPTLLSGPEGPALDIIVSYCGAIEEGEKLLRPLRSFGAPMVDTVAPVPYATLQNLLTEILQPGFLQYWKAGFIRAFSDEAIEALVDFFAGDVPTPFAELPLSTGLPVRSVQAPFNHRDARWLLVFADGATLRIRKPISTGCALLPDCRSRS
jgi:hypothetical protein